MDDEFVLFPILVLFMLSSSFFLNMCPLRLYFLVVCTVINNNNNLKIS